MEKPQEYIFALVRRFYVPEIAENWILLLENDAYELISPSLLWQVSEPKHRKKAQRPLSLHFAQLYHVQY